MHVLRRATRAPLPTASGCRVKLDVETLRAAAWLLAQEGARHQLISETPLRELCAGTSLSDEATYEWQLISGERTEVYQDAIDTLLEIADAGGVA